MNNKDLMKTAKKRVKDKKEFYTHLNAFCMVTGILFFINAIATPGNWWFFFPLIGWALAVLGHYLRIFGFPSFRDEIWEEEQFEIEMKKLERAQGLVDQEEDRLDLSNDELELRALKEKRRIYDSNDYV